MLVLSQSVFSLFFLGDANAGSATRGRIDQAGTVHRLIELRDDEDFVNCRVDSLRFRSAMDNG